jgi:hypothetical protein
VDSRSGGEERRRAGERVPAGGGGDLVKGRLKDGSLAGDRVVDAEGPDVVGRSDGTG